jgi:hypothetical protein
MVRHRRVRLKEAMKSAADYWDWGDDAVALIPLVLWPGTVLWYLIRGVPASNTHGASSSNG